ncbi:MAG: hypothetical protein AAB646_01150 [Patescibacteria group bacterium]
MASPFSKIISAKIPRRIAGVAMAASTVSAFAHFFLKIIVSLLRFYAPSALSNMA